MPDQNKLTDAQLVAQTDQSRGEAMVEMMRRLKRSNERLAVINIGLTIPVLLLTAAIVIVFFQD